MSRPSLLLLLALPLVGDANDRVAVAGDSLQTARSLYAASTDRPRRDCDPVADGRWVCASFDNPVLADVVASAPAPAPAVPVAPAAPTAPAIGAAVVGATLDAAKAAYARVTSQRRVDCDPIPGGRWVCASFQNPTLADVDEPPLAGATPPPTETPVKTPAKTPGETPPPTPVEVPVEKPVETPKAPPPPAPPSTSGEARLKLQAEDLPLGPGWRVESERAGAEGGSYAIWRGPNRYGAPGDGLTNLQFTVPRAGEYQLVIRARAVSPDRGDLSNDSWFRFPEGRWTKVFTTGQDSWQVGGTGDQDHRKFPFRGRLEAGVTTVQMSGRSERHAIDWIALERVGGGDTLPRVQASTALGPNDLLSLHYDSAPDPDDSQAMIFARLILDDYPGIDPLVINGTIGDKLPRSAFIEGSTEHLRTMFPDALDYFNDKERTVERAATAWQLTLEAGGTVHVAAGGPMDASADILRELERRGVSGLKRVRVVQHSAGRGAFNEDKTSDAAMALIRSKATYVTIANGNVGGNGSPDFNEPNVPELMRRALASEYGAQWARARTFFLSDAQNKIDASDTVELMHILGLPTSHAPTVKAFADRYFR